MNEQQQEENRHLPFLSVDVENEKFVFPQISDSQILAESSPSNAPPSHSPTNIFVARLPPWWTKETLREKFKVFGDIISTKVVPHRRYGFVEFTNTESAYAAIQQTDKTLPYFNSGASLHVSLAVHDEGADHLPNPRLFIRGLPYWATQEHLVRAFSPFGEVVQCETLVSSQGHCKGSGFVQFTTTEEAVGAIEARELIRIPDWLSPLEVRFSEAPETRQERQKRNRIRQQCSGLSPAPVQSNFIVPTVLPVSPSLFSPPPPPLPSPSSSFVFFPFFHPVAQGTPLNSPLSTATLQNTPSVLPVPSSIYVVPPSPLSGDLSFVAPSVTSLVVSALLQPFGKIEKIYPTGEKDTIAARMADTTIHAHISGTLNGTVLSTGDILVVGIYS